jgi:archaellum component FlaC
MLIIAPLFVFHSVLIDIVRIRIAERESDSSLRTALRSTLSAYDNTLKNYGLYALGLGEVDAEKLFQQVLSRNLGGTDSSKGWSLVKPLADVQSVKLQGLYTLANHTVFRQQVLEEMKYRAPAEFTVQVVDKLMGGSNTVSALSGASTFEKQANEIEDWIAQRELVLDEAWNMMLSLKEKTSIYHSYYTIRLSELEHLSSQIGIGDVSAIQQSLSALQHQSEQIQQAMTVSSSSLQELLKKAKENAELIQDVRSNMENLQSSLNSVYAQMTDLQTMLQVIPQYLLLLEMTKAEVARDANVIMSLQGAVLAKIDEAEGIDEQIRKFSNNTSSNGAAPILTVDIIGQMVKPAAYYALYKVDASSISGLMNGFSGAIQATTPFLGDNRWSPERYSTLAQSNEAYSARASSVITSRQAEEATRKQTSASVDRQRNDQLDRMNEVIDQLKKLVAECGGVTGGQSVYEILEKNGPDGSSHPLSAKYVDYNRIQRNFPEPATEEDASSSINSAEAAKRGAFHLIDSLVPMIGNLARSFRDELYVNEYALEKFNYRTFGKQQEEGGREIRSAALSNPGYHPLRNQEAEYILYGHASCILNQSSAYAEMFAFRLAVRMTEALLDTKAKAIAAAGSPLLLVLWAAAEGAIQAYQDMTKLVEGNPVPVSEKLAGSAVTMNYKDYLRIFYMLHSNNQMTMSRVQALIETNTGRDLTERYTYLQGTVTASERLWFFPYLEPFIAYEVKRNRVVLEQTAYLSY